MIAKHVLIAGGGLVGMDTAFRLQKLLRREIKRGQVKLTIVDPQSYMTYQSFLPEAAAGSIEPRHVVVPLRKVLKRVDVIAGRIAQIDHGQKKVRIEPHAGQSYELGYDELVVALGSVTRTLPIPGLAEVGIGFKTVQEAIWLRNHVLERLDVAASVGDLDARRRALSFVFVGGGYTGAEAIGELEDMARDVIKQYYKELDPSWMRWILVDASNRILPEVGDRLGEYAAESLRKRGIDVKLETTLVSAVGGHVVLSDGTELDTDTLVWSAGAKPNPILTESDLPIDDRGRVRTRTDLRVVGLDGVWAAGDNAAVHDLSADDPQNTLLAPNAQHAVREAKTLAKNIAKVIRGKEPEPYKHRYMGSVASLGLHKGVALVYGIRLRGLIAWFMHRTYHVGKMPTFNRKVRIVLDWTLAFFFRREPVSLGSFEVPHAEFRKSAAPTPRHEKASTPDAPVRG